MSVDVRAGCAASAMDSSDGVDIHLEKLSVFAKSKNNKGMNRGLSFASGVGE
jgi:hypothetical protein